MESGYLPHNGIATIAQFVTGTYQGEELNRYGIPSY